MTRLGYYEYIEFDKELFFTAVLLPYKDGAFPTVIIRSPYVSDLTDKTEKDILQIYLAQYESWLSYGYTVIVQHCRGQGKSTGGFVPYIYEREDGLELRRWIRAQSFYNGELFLLGGSYTASVHYTTAPFEADIKGAVLEVQDTERYRLWYRNGQMRKGHANWHFDLYKPKCNLNKTHTMNSFSELPICGLSERVLGERSEDFEQMLEAQCPTDDFWDTRFGGNEARNVTDNIPFPVLFTTGFHDFYVGGMFSMWNRMNEQSRARCSMLVSPYDHGDGHSLGNGIAFPNGQRREQFGSNYAIMWFEHIRKRNTLPFEKGVITYYNLFENIWKCDFYKNKIELLEIPLGEGKVSFDYDPMEPPAFCEEGAIQRNCFKHARVISQHTSPLGRPVFVKGKMQATLCVSSNCPDTSFYISISIQKPQGDYRLRHDITSLSYQLGDYSENEIVYLQFSFDEHAFLLRENESLRIDICSTDNNVYVSHTNMKGPYYLQTESQVATNSVYLNASKLILPIEEK